MDKYLEQFEEIIKTFIWTKYLQNINIYFSVFLTLGNILFLERKLYTTLCCHWILRFSEDFLIFWDSMS